MRIFHKSALTAAALLTALALGCHAQVPAPGKQLSPELARRVEILIRQRTKLSPDYLINVGAREPSDIPGFDKIPVTFTADGQVSPALTFLLSTDGKTLAQFNKYDISKDPKSLVSDDNRPARGGPESAPVQIVAFDDLECPFCTRMHAALFPALTEHYGSLVHIVYRDFPLTEIHPWALRAAVDVNCVAAQSGSSYWTLIDYIHAHAAEIGLPDKTIARANEQIDQLSNDQAKKDKLNTTAVAACVKKQDTTAVKASMKVGSDLDIGATPVLFINGEKLEGFYPQDAFRMIDQALTAAGKTPPPPYVLPAPPLVTPPATKPGN